MRRRPPLGAWFISPGLHYDGPDDPRMHRLAVALCNAGYVIYSPAIPSLTAQRITSESPNEVFAAFEHLMGRARALRLGEIGVFSVSIGSLGAVRLAASSDSSAHISRIVMFGGYADPIAVMHQMVGTDDEPLLDPLNKPVAFLHLIDDLPCPVHDKVALSVAWREFIRATWPQQELKSPESTRHIAIAESMANRVHPDDCELFLMGCGARPGARAICDSALQRAELGFLDPRPHLAAVSAPVTLVHGVSDPIIPVSQMDVLAAGLPDARTYPLGMNGHSGWLSIGTYLKWIGAETRTMLDVVRAIM